MKLPKLSETEAGNKRGPAIGRIDLSCSAVFIIKIHLVKRFNGTKVVHLKLITDSLNTNICYIVIVLDGVKKRRARANYASARAEHTIMTTSRHI